MRYVLSEDIKERLGMVALGYNPSYFRDRERSNRGLRPAWQKVDHLKMMTKYHSLSCFCFSGK
jgi:hypothetical protein